MQAHGFQKPAKGPRITLANGRAVYVGPGLDLAPHRNLAATIAIALQSPFHLLLLEQGARDAEERTCLALIPSGSLHHLRANGDMAFIYLDAMSDDYAQIRRADLASVHARVSGQLLEAASQSDVDTLCRVLGVVRREARDDRIAAVVRLIDEQPQEFESIAKACRLAGLSASRFQGLFRQSVGMPFRRYRLWRRMAIVLKAVASGATLTNAALEAGFSSSAHLSSTFKAMFGLTPSSLIALGVQIDCHD